MNKKYYILASKSLKRRSSANGSITSSVGAVTSLILMSALGLVGAGNVSATSISINVSSETIVDATAPNATGKFSSSPASNISVSTDNYTGYTLSIKAANNNTDNPSMNNALINTVDNTKYIPSIPSGSSISPANFADDTYASSNNLNNTWGYLPSFYNSSANTNYLPAPTDTITGDILNETHCANGATNGSYNCPNTTDEYTITLGTRTDATQDPGTYSNTFIIEAVANGTPYTITYNANAGSDSTVANMPTNITASDNAVSFADTINLGTTTPTRTGYTFAGWCASNASQTSCSSTLYNSTNGNLASYPIDRTSSSNNVEVSAIWQVNTYTQTVNYYYQTATGTAGTMMTYTENVAYGSNFTFTYAKASSFNSTTHSTTMYTTNAGTTTKTINYTVTGTTTNTVYFHRNTRTISLTKGTGIDTVSVTGTGVKSGSGTASATVYYGGTVTIAAVLSSNYDWVNWTGSATYTSQSQSISNVTSNLSFTANGKSSKLYFQNATSANCGSTMYDNRGTDAYKNVAYTTAEIGSLCWMTRNLDLPGGTTLTSSDSNVTSNYTLPASSTSGFSNASTAYVYNSDSTNFNDTSCGDKNPCYSYYSYVAATAGTNPSSGAASSDICPKGWRLPTRAELTTLKNTYTTGATLTASPFLGVYAGRYDSNSFYSGGSLGYYWSSTAYDSSFAYSLYFYSSSAFVDYYYKNNGNYVRCVRSL